MKNRPGGQGSSGGSGSGSGDSGSDYTGGNSGGAGDEVVPLTPDEMPFGFPGKGEDYSWTDDDYNTVDEIIGVTDENGELKSGIEKLQQDGVLKTKDDIKRYLNELMEDDGISLAQYQALKLIYEID
jgi:hypothetical protein